MIVALNKRLMKKEIIPDNSAIGHLRLEIEESKEPKP